MAVDKKQLAAIKITGAIEAANAEVTVAPVVSDKQTANALQNIREGAITEFFDVVRRDDGYRSRRIGYFLLELRGAGDRWHLDLHQLFNAELRKLRFLRAGRARF